MLRNLRKRSEIMASPWGDDGRCQQMPYPFAPQDATTRLLTPMRRPELHVESERFAGDAILLEGVALSSPASASASQAQQPPRQLLQPVRLGQQRDTFSPRPFHFLAPKAGHQCHRKIGPLG